MPHDDVRDFVSHYARKFRFAGRRYRPGVHVDWAARQGEGIDVFLIHDPKRVRKFIARSLRGQLVAKRVDVLRNWMIDRQQRQFFFNFRNRLPPVVDFLFEGVAIAAGRIRRDPALLGIDVGEKNRESAE